MPFEVEEVHRWGQSTGKDKMIVETFIVGKDNKNDYHQKLKMSIYYSDALIRRPLSKGFLFEEQIVIALWNVLPKKGTFIDVGANVGTIVVPIAKHVEKCIAFEPQRFVRKLLKKNIRDNNIKNIKVIKGAAGHYNGRAELDKNIVDHNGVVQELEYSGTKKINYGGVKVGVGGPKIKIFKIDSMKIKKLIGMKVDVEGHEPAVFYGARKTIKRYRPIIAFENNFQKIDPDTENLKALKLTDKILNFDIVNYAETLGYNCILEIMLDNYMLCPTELPITTDNNFKFYPVNNFANNRFSYSKLKKFKLKKIIWN